MQNYEILEKAFGRDFSVTQAADESGAQTETLRFSIQPIGNLLVSTGSIIACDPLVAAPDSEPFVNAFPRGAFPVELAIARYDDGSADERVAFARLKFSDAAPARWEGALAEGQDPAELEEGELYGYGVDSGLGAFMDTAGREALERLMEEDDDYEETLEGEFEKNYRHTRSWLLWQRGEANVAMFTSGLGDGFYPSFVGFDADGGICRLVTDFGLVEW
jgi:hypothetical protein